MRKIQVNSAFGIGWLESRERSHVRPRVAVGRPSIMDFDINNAMDVCKKRY
jgi:hypothetical protein